MDTETQEPITSPRHPLQMKLAAAEMGRRKWRNIADSCEYDTHRHLWAAKNRAFYEVRVAELKAEIAAAAANEKGGRA